jgi:Na+/H+ antiporter NhaD/arsenite permease-like protein
MISSALMAAVVNGPEPHPLMVTPFALILLCIALLPFVNHAWWEHNYHIVAVTLGSITIGYYLFVLRNWERMLDVTHEYVSFIALIGSLFVVAGGIHITVRGKATPLSNCVFLVIGAVLTNIIGTTGASMLLIRPWIRMNRHRINAFHIVFFIFIVSNIGGCLTPIGDPPLFLGYLKGVPFWWVLENCIQAWSIAVFGLVGIFYVFDKIDDMRETKPTREAELPPEQWKFEGAHNIFYLAIILLAVFLNNPPAIREVLMIGAAVASFYTTAPRIHKSNEFNFAPIKEVAWLFFGIFATMVPALDYLSTHAKEIGIDTELKFYWLTGLLSGVLDNAPTYLTFLATALGSHDLSINNPEHIRQFVRDSGHYLIAISLGAVFFGAMTYIGNGPNFMVKAIAQHARVPVPDFVGYLVRYALPILLPFLWVVGILFFSRWRIF